MKLNDIPWLSAIGALILVPLLLNFDVNLLLPLLTDALFLIVLGLELPGTSHDRDWLHVGWMGVTWGVSQLMGLVDMGLDPFRWPLSLVMIGLAVQYFSKKEFIEIPELEMLTTLTTPLLILASFTFINLIVSTSLVTGALFLAAASYLIKDENEYAGYLAPLGVLLIGYTVLL